MHSIPSIHDQATGQDTLKKAVAYAATDSPYATRYNNGEGFHYIEIRWQADGLDHKVPMFGADTLALESYRFETLYHAERCAESLTFFNWCPQYLSNPPHGSKFDQAPVTPAPPARKVILIMEDWHSERSNCFRAYEADSTTAFLMFPLIGYCSPGGSYRTIRETLEHASKRVPSGTEIYRGWHSGKPARLLTVTK